MTACLDITLFKKVDIYIFIYICVSEIACNIVLQHGDKDNVGKRKKIQTLHRKFHILNLDSGRTATARVNPTSCGAPSCHLKNQRHAREPTAEPDRWFGSQGSKSEHLGGRGGTPTRVPPTSWVQVSISVFPCHPKPKPCALVPNVRFCKQLATYLHRGLFIRQSHVRLHSICFTLLSSPRNNSQCNLPFFHNLSITFFISFLQSFFIHSFLQSLSHTFLTIYRIQHHVTN